MSLIAKAAGVKEEDILGHDLFLYNRQPGTIWGADETFLSCGRLDDLQCAFSSVKAVIEGERMVPVYLWLLSLITKKSEAERNRAQILH